MFDLFNDLFSDLPFVNEDIMGTMALIFGLYAFDSLLWLLKRLFGSK